MAASPLKTSINRALRLASDARVLRLPVIVACAILTVLIHLAPNGATVQGSIWVRIIIATVAYLPGLATIAVCVGLTRNMKSENWRITLMLVSYFVAGALRGVVLSLSFYGLGMADALNLDFRIPGSAIPFGLAIGVATYAVGALDESKSRIASLRALEHELSEAVTDSAEQNSALRDRTISRIEESIQDRLAPLSTISNETSADELRALAADVVRPLSHSLAERVPTWQPRPGTMASIRWRDIFGQIKPELSLRPALLSALCMGTGITAFIYFFGIELAIPMFISSAVALYLSTRAMQAVAVRLKPIPNLFGRAALMTAMLVVISLPAGLIDVVISRTTSDPTFGLRAGVMIVPIFGWFIAIGGAAQAETARMEEEITEKIGRLTWLKSRLNLMNWYEQGELARVLHGPVQSVINQGVIRLKAADSQQRTQILTDVSEGIESVLAPELRWNGSTRSFEELCQDLAFTWADICKIDFAISPMASTALASDPAAASLCWDIVYEACNNAVQHGKARWVSVRISDPLDTELTIEVLDNGSEYVMNSKAGMGSNMLDACTISWSRQRDASQTRLLATLPIQG